jgi:uncharacterized membrane protein
MTTEQPKAATPNKTSTGLDENIAMLLCYIAGWVTGIVFYIIEKDNKNVKFAAMQSIVVFGGLTAIMIVISILSVILGYIPVVGHILGILLWIVSSLCGLGGFVLWIILIVKSLQGTVYKVPFAGDMAEKYVK